jgi:hypothetical protein
MKSILSHRVVPAWMEGMALQNPPHGKSDTSNSAILSQRLERINRTGRGKPTTLGQKRREYVLIYPYEQHDYFIHIALLPIDQDIREKMTEKSVGL